MDRAQEPPAELLEVQSLIWLHALLGTILTLVFFWASFASREVLLLAGLLGCAVAWLLAFGPIARSAEALAPTQRPPAKGAPLEVLGVWAVAEICSLAILEGREWILAGHLLVGGTILLRGLMAIAFEVPIHRRTWGISLAILAVGTVGHLAGIIGNLTWGGR
jgi:hypothetical protein